ncbi:MAG TPA: ComF family protein [Terriglobales bacterium]|nr:ComF family protein [Terriglobales bacterium]
MREVPPYEKATAYGSYEAGLRELIHLLKYDRVMPAADILGRMTAEALQDITSDFGSDLPLVVPVPLHETKRKQRGFNQSEHIAQAMVKASGLKLELAPELLERKRPTESQTGLTRQQRIANMRGAFRATNSVQKRDILLVDDVFTTGTTVSECARVLRKAGAGKVWVATVARVLKAESSFARVEGEQEHALAMAAGAYA